MFTGEKKPLIIIFGPTATGKTKIGVHLANKFNGEIISADSRQVYKSLNIGTGKDLEEYNINGSQINYHLIDVVEPNYEFSLFNFVEEFNKSYNLILEKNKLPFLVGGTGNFVNAIISNYEFKNVDFNSMPILYEKSTEDLRQILLNINPNLHNSTDLLDKERIIKAIIIALSDDNDILKPIQNIVPLFLAVYYPRSENKKRITERLKNRLKNGMIEEVDLLLKSGITEKRLIQLGLEYKFITEYLTGKLNYNDMFQKLNSAIHLLSKKQMTWLRKFELKGNKVLKISDLHEAEMKIKRYLKEEFDIV